MDDNARPERIESVELDPIRLEAYLESLDEGLPEHLRQLEEDALADFVPIIRRPTQRFLRFLCRSRSPRRILEIGSGVGFSGKLMLFYAKEAHLTTIENYPPRILSCEKNFQAEIENDRLTFIPKDAGEVLPTLTESYDLIFLDAAKGQYPMLLEDVLRLLSKDGILVTDNVLQEGDLLESHYTIPRRNRTIHKRMRDYLYQLTHTDGISTEILPLGDGIALTVKI